MVNDLPIVRPLIYIAASYKNENIEAIKNRTFATPHDNVVMNSSIAETTATAKNRNVKKAKSTNLKK